MFKINILYYKFDILLIMIFKSNLVHKSQIAKRKVRHGNMQKALVEVYT